jgi:uncharacterized membrane protein YidH (DUF202 family)
VPYTVVGLGFAGLGVAFIAYAYRRHKEVEQALARGDFVAPDERLIAVLAACGIVLGLLVLVIIAAAS